MITGTICVVIVLAMATNATIEILHPEADTSTLGTNINNAISALIGLLSGFLAGRTDTARRWTNGDRK